jgi:tetratricopeptide (TPR) repeat protein
VLCLYVQHGKTVSFNLLTEIVRCTGERIFLFWDDAADKPFEIEQLVSESMRKGLRLTVFTAERANAWNMACGNLDRLLTGDYNLRYLSHAEIEVRAGRQILVALHEATLGPPFEEILLNEFNEIQPEQARRLYLTICVLNRLNVQVRAGLIARVHGVPFSEFREKFFGPLEHVVLAHKNDNIGDYLYRARHPEIAQIVFQQVLKEPTDRFNEYVRLLRDLNLAYTSDETAFRELTRARNLHELFPNHEDADALFAVAMERAPDDPYLLQQRANYERLRPNGNLSLALELLSKARGKAPRDNTILHTLGETLRAQSLSADTLLKRERFRKEARVVISNLIRDQDLGQEAFPRHTLVKLALDDVRDVLADTNSPERVVDETIREAERTLLESIQRCPDEELFLQAEAELGKLIGDDSRALHAMEAAFRKNPRDPYIASRLASIYESKDDKPRALETIRSALDSNRGDKTLNFYVCTASTRSGTGESRCAPISFSTGFCEMG